MRTPGIHVRPVDSVLMPAKPHAGTIFDPDVPEEEQTGMITMGYFSLDGYRRMVGSCFSGVSSDFVLQIGGILPENTETLNGSNHIPLVFLAVYETEIIQEESAFTVLNGRIVPFDVLKDSCVFEGEGYTVYDVTDLYYTDLDTYVDAVTGKKQDAAVYRRLRAVRDYYRTPDNLNFSLMNP